MNKLIEAKNISYVVENQCILDNINLEIKKGEFISIVGLNGCGKSTLAKMFNGILTPTTGDMLIDGFNTSDLSILHKIRKKIGMVFQNPENQIIASNVEEEIAFGLENLCVDPQKMGDKIKNALKIVDMEGFEKRSVLSLSGGQKQRLNIASIIAMEPEIILLDEPTSMLDPSGRDNILDVLIKLNKEHGTTIILITHFMQEVIMTDRVILMDNGSIKAINSPKELFLEEEFLKYLFPMQSAEILFFLKNLGYNVFTSAFETENCAKEIIKILENN